MSPHLSNHLNLRPSQISLKGICLVLLPNSLFTRSFLMHLKKHVPTTLESGNFRCDFAFFGPLTLTNPLKQPVPSRKHCPKFFPCQETNLCMTGNAAVGFDDSVVGFMSIRKFTGTAAGNSQLLWATSRRSPQNLIRYSMHRLTTMKTHTDSISCRVDCRDVQKLQPPQRGHCWFCTEDARSGRHHWAGGGLLARGPQRPCLSNRSCALDTYVQVSGISVEETANLKPGP